jgi:hypothetical protein
MTSSAKKAKCPTLVVKVLQPELSNIYNTSYK